MRQSDNKPREIIKRSSEKQKTEEISATSYWISSSLSLGMDGISFSAQRKVSDLSHGEEINFYRKFRMARESKPLSRQHYNKKSNLKLTITPKPFTFNPRRFARLLLSKRTFIDVVNCSEGGKTYKASCFHCYLCQYNGGNAINALVASSKGEKDSCLRIQRDENSVWEIIFQYFHLTKAPSSSLHSFLFTRIISTHSPALGGKPDALKWNFTSNKTRNQFVLK